MRGVLLAACVLAIGCDDDNFPDAGAADMAASDTGVSTASVTRGEYLVKFLLACGDCHTTPDSRGQPQMTASAFLAGGRDFPVGSMHVFTSNLTPDDTTGLGTWTQDQIVRAIRDGLDNMGKPLFP